MRIRTILIWLTLWSGSVLKTPAYAQAADDSLGVREAALDYIEGWYAGDAGRMRRALHPELAKRVVFRESTGRTERIESIGALTLIERTEAGGGRRTPVSGQQKDIRVLDIFANAATAKIIASEWVDYLQLVRWRGRWRIVNVLWELKPGAGR